MKFYIEKIRKEKNISLSELSRRSGVAKSALSYIEMYASDPKVSTMCKIAKALDVHVIDLFACDRSRDDER